MKQSKENFDAIGPMLKDNSRKFQSTAASVEDFEAIGPALKDQDMRFVYPSVKGNEHMTEWRDALKSRGDKYTHAASMVEHMRVAANEDPRENAFMDQLFGSEDLPPVRTGVQAKPVFGTLLGAASQS